MVLQKNPKDLTFALGDVWTLEVVNNFLIWLYQCKLTSVKAWRSWFLSLRRKQILVQSLKRTYPSKWRSIEWHSMNIPRIHFAWSDRLLECRSLADWSNIKSTHAHCLQSTCGIRAICKWVLIRARCLSNRLRAIGKCHSMDRHFEGYVHDLFYAALKSPGLCMIKVFGITGHVSSVL